MKSRFLLISVVFVSWVWASSDEVHLVGADADVPAAVAALDRALHAHEGVSEEVRRLDASAADVDTAVASLHTDVGVPEGEDLRGALTLIAASLRAHLPTGTVPEGTNLMTIVAATVDALETNASLRRRLRSAEQAIDCLTRSQEAMTRHFMNASRYSDHREADSDDDRGEGGASSESTLPR